MTKLDREADVIIVGGGAASHAAAVTAASQGARVLLVEKADAIGGTTAKSSGAYWIPNNRYLRERGLEDPRDDALRLMARLSYPSSYDPEAPSLGIGARNHGLLAAFYDNAAPAIEALAEMGALRSMPQPLFGEQIGDVDWAVPEYHAELPENRAPYGRTLLPDFDLMSGVLGGAEIINQCQAFLVDHGAEVATGHRATGLIVEDGAVVGLEVEHSGGSAAFGAANGVIFGSGGFTHNREKALGYLRGPIISGCAVPTNTGDFIDIAAGVGAALGNLSNAFWSQSALEPTLERGFVEWDEDIFIPFGDSMLIVDKRGGRIGNEKVPYHERTQSHMQFDQRTGDYPNLVQFMVWDSAVADYEPWHMYRYPVPEPGATSPWVLSAPTWEELAILIAARLDRVRRHGGVGAAIAPSVQLSADFASNIRATVARFGELAETGLDVDFGRGTTAIQQSWGSVPRDNDTRANKTMRPFAPNGPYYCVLLCGGTLDTCGGPVIDGRARVLRPSGEAIPGLFGAGNCIASPTGQAYWSAGSTLGPALTFGHLAGLEAMRGRGR
jgi:hypothetical protein